MVTNAQEILPQSDSHVRCPVLGTVCWDTGVPGHPVPNPAPVNTQRGNKVVHVLFWLFLGSVSSVRLNIWSVYLHTEKIAHLVGRGI